MAIAPYFYNGPTYNGKTPNLLFSDVYQGTLPNPVITLEDSILSLPVSGYTFPVRIQAIKRYDYTAYAAGTAGNYTLNFAGITPVVGKVYHWTIFGGSSTTPYTVSGVAIATTAALADLVTAVNTSLTNANGANYYTNTIVGSTITLAETSSATGGFSFQFPNDTNFAFTINTANTASFGTTAQVQLYKPSITSGNFDLHQWSVDVYQDSFAGTTTKTLVPDVIQIWVDQAATGYSLATTQLQAYGHNGTFWASSYSQAQMQQMNNIPR